MVAFKPIVGILFILLVVAIIALSAFSYENNKRFLQTSSLVRHSNKTIQKADEISRSYAQVRLTINRMIIMRDADNYFAYTSGIARLFLELDTLKHLTADNKLQHLTVDSVRWELHEFKVVSDSLIRLINADAAQEIIGQLYFISGGLKDDLKAKIDRIKDREKQMLLRRELATEKSIASFTKTFVFLLVGIAVLIVSTFAVVRYNFNKREEAEDKMKKSLEAEIELNKLKSNFVTLASHEFRTPLATILSSAFLLENYSLKQQEEKAGKHLARIKSSVNNLTSILDEFLCITKLEEGKTKPNIERTDISKFVGNICQSLQTVAKPGQRIRYEHTGERQIETDPVLLASIVNNLITNSIKYSEENSEIDVTTTVNSKVQLTVKDYGIGIPVNDQKHLFKRFYRASNAGNVQGTGLGLHLMKSYVEMLNGTVSISSEVGRGTLVEVVFDQPQTIGHSNTTV